jgi:hypothetical protein
MTNSTIWPRLIGLYVLGATATSAALTLTGLLSEAAHGAASLVLWLLGLTAVAGLVAIGRGRPRRERVALAVGAVSPLAALAVLFAWLVWALAHYQF